MSATNDYFACSETPIKLENITENQDILEVLKQQKILAKVRITSLIAGTGHVTPNGQGLAFDLPQTTLEFNGVRHSCYGCLLSFPAMHSINVTGLQYKDLSAAELHVQFKGDTDATRSSYYTLVVPIKIGEGQGADFFASLGNLQRTRPTFGSILSEDTPLIMYKGTDLAGRLKDTASTCSNDVQKVQYLVALRPLFLRFSDLTRLKAKLPTTYVGPVQATMPIQSAKLPLISYIPSILLTKSTVPKKIVNGYVEQAQVKCRPLNQSEDIKGSQVYVGGPGKYKTLKDELQDAADLSKMLEGPEATADVSRIETILAIVLGVLLGVFLIAVVIWWGLRKEGGYTRMSLLWSVAKLKKEGITKEVGEAMKVASKVAVDAAKAAKSPH
jgi:hypothetical protein